METIDYDRKFKEEHLHQYMDETQDFLTAIRKHLDVLKNESSCEEIRYAFSRIEHDAHMMKNAAALFEYINIMKLARLIEKLYYGYKKSNPLVILNEAVLRGTSYAVDCIEILINRVEKNLTDENSGTDVDGAVNIMNKLYEEFERDNLNKTE